jgi:hypothetical protein
MTLEYRCSHCGTLLQTTNADALETEIERLRALGPDDDWEERGAAGALRAEIERLRGLSPDNMPKNETEWWIALKDQNREIERLRAALQICASHSESSNYQGALSYVRKIARRALEPKP